MTDHFVTTDLIAYNFNLETATPHHGFQEMIEYDHLGQSFMHELAREGDVLSAEVMAMVGRDVDTPDAEGKRPLHEAAFFGHLDMVSFLLDNGAMLDAPVHPFGFTPLYYAVEQGHMDVVRLLLRKGAALNVVDRLRGEGLLHLTAHRGDIKMAGLLIAAGMNVFYEMKNGQTARDVAARYHHKELENILLKVMEHHAVYGV